MFGFIKKRLIGLSCFGGLLAPDHIKSVSVNNRPCQVRPTTPMKIFNIHLLSVLISVLDVAILLMIHMLEYMFQIILSVNETRFLIQHNSCERKYRLSENVCNSKQKWNHGKCRCECKELDE